MLANEFLLGVKVPWVSKLINAEKNTITEVKRLFHEKPGAKLFSLDGRKMSNLKGFYNEFALKLGFPDYFSHNLNSLEEILSDLDWLDFSACTILIIEADSLLSSESIDVLEGVIEVFEYVCEGWNQDLEESGGWIRTATPFNVLLSLGNEENLREPFKKVPSVSLN